LVDEFAEGFASAIDDIRHEVERAAYGRETTGNIELPEVQAPSYQEAAQGIEPPQMESPEPSRDMER
jgi:hypothetical protein